MIVELVFEHIRKNYGEKKALYDISLTLNEGIYGLLGPNGAGKSTLMNILTGNLTQTSGHILLDGQEVSASNPLFRAKIGYMPQQQALYPTFTPERFLYYVAALRGMSKSYARERIDWVLQLLSLEKVRCNPIRTLSGGMKQRLLLAQAVLDDPDILVLDEPTAGLDPRQRIAVRNLIAKIALHKIIILSTHVVPDVEYISKEIILLSEGVVLNQNSASQLSAELEGWVWEVNVSEADLERVYMHGKVCSLNRDDDGVKVRLLARDTPPFPCAEVRPNLEDIYLHYFGEDLEL